MLPPDLLNTSTAAGTEYRADWLCGPTHPWLDTSQSWYTPDPDLQPCLYKSALVWLPCALLWLFAPVLVSPRRHLPAVPLHQTDYRIVWQQLFTVLFLCRVFPCGE